MRILKLKFSNDFGMHKRITFIKDCHTSSFQTHNSLFKQHRLFLDLTPPSLTYLLDLVYVLLDCQRR